MLVVLTVEVDLTVLKERTNIHAVRYAWPLGDDGDTCCPGADVAAGLRVCTPAACPILSAKAQAGAFTGSSAGSSTGSRASSSTPSSLPDPLG